MSGIPVKADQVLTTVNDGGKGVQTIGSADTLDLAETALQLKARARAGETRAGWQSRYARKLYLFDLAVGLLAAASALVLRFGSSGAEPYNRGYLLLTFLFPIAWTACACSTTEVFDP